MKFEYKIVQYHQTEEALNALGKEGWDLFCVEESHLGDIEFYFKREIQ